MRCVKRALYTFIYHRLWSAEEQKNLKMEEKRQTNGSIWQEKNKIEFSLDVRIRTALPNAMVDEFRRNDHASRRDAKENAKMCFWFSVIVDYAERHIQICHFSSYKWVSIEHFHFPFTGRHFYSKGVPDAFWKCVKFEFIRNSQINFIYLPPNGSLAFATFPFAEQLICNAKQQQTMTNCEYVVLVLHIKCNILLISRLRRNCSEVKESGAKIVNSLN